MNNASFHMSSAPNGGGGGGVVGTGRHHHPLLLLPNHGSSPVNSSLLQPSRHVGGMPTGAADSAASASAAMTAYLNGGSPPAVSALNFAGRELLQFSQMNGGFPYLHGFGGMPMLNMGFGLFPGQHHALFAKSPGMMTSMPTFFNNFSGNMKDDDLAWHKRSPNGMSDSPRSGSRGSPLENPLHRQRLPKGKALAEQNLCPICGQMIHGMAMQEHFFDELKAYRQEPVSAKSQDSRQSQEDVSGCSPPAGGTGTVQNAAVHQAGTPSKTGDVDTRHEIFLRIRASRRGRHRGASPNGDLSHSTSRRPSSCAEPRLSFLSQKPTTSQALETAISEETELIVDVESDDVREAPAVSPVQLNSPTHSSSSTSANRMRLQSPSVGSRKRSLNESDGDDDSRQGQGGGSGAVRRRSSSSVDSH